MPNGNGEAFEKQLAEWEKQYQFYSGQFDASQKRLESYRQELEQTYNVEVRDPSSWWGRFPSWLGGVVNISEKLSYSAIPVQAPGARRRSIRANINITVADIERNDFFTRLYREVPIAAATGEVASADDVLAALKPPDNLTSDELSSIRDTISSMITGLTERTKVAEPSDIIYPEIVPPGPPPTPTSIQAVATQEVIKSLLAPRIPPTAMTAEEWTSFLRAKGYDDEDINTEMQIEAEGLIADWAERNNQIEAFKAGIAEMPDYKFTDMLKEAAISPGLAVMEVASMYFEYVTQPLAGALYKLFIPDLEAEYQRYKNANPDASTREALVHAWNAWDAPFEGTKEWMLKYLLMEGLVDPLSYVGWGIATKITKPLGSLGRLVGAAERGALEVLDIPFDVMKAGIKRLPTTVGQRALLAQHKTGQYVEKYVTKSTGYKLSMMDMKIFGKAVKRTVKFTKKHPFSETSIGRAGREVLKHTPVDEEIVMDWASRLGTTLRPNDITRVTVENVDNVFEDMFTKRIATYKEAAGQLLKILHPGEASDKVLSTAQRLLERRAALIEEKALAFTTADTPLKAMRSLMNRNFRTHIAIEDSAAALSRKEAGRASTLLYDLELQLQGVWRNKIDKWIVRPTAEAYLTFGMYGPMNVLEDYIRSALGGVFPRRMTKEAWDDLTVGLITPAEMRRSGLSETLGPLTREGAEDTWNNWIIQIAALGKKGWSEKIYKGLVRIPGGWGMDLRRNFVAKRFLQILADEGGDVFKALAKAGPKSAPSEITQKWLRKDLESFAYRLKVSGNAKALRAGKDLFTRDKILKNELDNILKEHPDLPNSAREYIMKAFDDRSMFREAGDSIERTITGAKGIILDDFIRGPEAATQQYRQLADFLTSLEVKNPQEMASAIQALHKMSEVYGALPEQIIARATVRNRGLPLAERRASFDADFDRIYQFLDSAGADIDKVINKLRLGITPEIGSEGYKDAATRLFDTMMVKREIAAEFRAQNMVLRHDYFAGVKKADMTPAFWDNFDLLMKNDYRGFNLKMAEKDGQIVRALQEVNTAAGAKVTSRAPIVIKDRPLAPQDIANLLGVRGDDISRGILDVLTIQNNKDFFVTYVQAMARPGDAGFTKEAIESVYDQIAYSLRVSPESMSWISGKQLELEAVRKELHSLYNSKLLPDNEVAAIGRYLDDTAEAVEKTMYAKAPGAPARTLKPEYASYDDLRQSAMNKAEKWYYKEYTDYTNANAFDAMMKTIYPYWSLSEDTEVMSRDGWKHYWQLSENDELLSLDKDKMLTYWDKIQYINVYDYDGEASHMHCTGKDFVSTPNHWWIAKKERKDKYEYIQSKDLYPQMAFPKAAPHCFATDSLLTLEEAAIIGWLITDGTIRGVGYMAIQQSKQPQVDAIRQLTTDVGALSKESIDTLGTHVFSLTKEWKEKIDWIFTAYDLVYIVTHLSAEAAEAMWQAMWQAEGCNRTNCFVQKEGVVLDAFEVLSFLTGRFVTKHRHNGEFDARNIWQLYIHKTKQFRSRNLKLDWIHYKGKMWCPRVEHRGILIKRNNCVSWSSNTYESQRWFWLPRSFVRHPGTFTSFERWQNNSDYGYIHVPGTSIDINPFRGTIYGTMTTRLTRRDFPEYYDSLGAAKGMVEFNDYLSRFGFYPGAHIGVPLAIMGGLEQQMGETMPSIWKTPLNALVAAQPKSESVKWLSDHIFSDRFRDYMTILEVNKRDYNGSHIWTKIKENIDLTEEEQSIWDESRGEAALYGMGFEQFGLFRLRTDEQYRAYEESSKVIEEMTGYTPEQQDWLRRHGYRIWDTIGGLSPTNQAILQELDSYKWLGTVTPLLPSRQQQELRRLDLDWDSVTQYSEQAQQERIQLQQDFLAGRLGPRDYNDRLQTLFASQREYIDKRIEENPNMTLEGRKEYYKKYGIAVPVQHPMRELLNLYFSVDLEDKYDEETGELTTDWDSFYAQRQAIEDAIPEELKGEWESYLTRNSTQIEQVRRDVYNKYFRKYYDIWEATLGGYPGDEQKLTNEYLYLERTGRQLERQAEIKALVSERTGRQLISSFRTDVSNNRAALRFANPTMDAWLFFWGRTSSFKTPQAQAIYTRLCKDTGRVT